MMTSVVEAAFKPFKKIAIPGFSCKENVGDYPESPSEVLDAELRRNSCLILL